MTSAVLGATWQFRTYAKWRSQVHSSYIVTEFVIGLGSRSVVYASDTVGNPRRFASQASVPGIVMRDAAEASQVGR